MVKHKKKRHKNKNQQVNNVANKRKSKKKLVIKVILAVIIFIVLVVAFFNAHGYLEYERKRHYVAGGRDALNMIVEDSKTSGGVTININNEEITLARYNKEIERTNENKTINKEE